MSPPVSKSESDRLPTVEPDLRVTTPPRYPSVKVVTRRPKATGPAARITARVRDGALGIRQFDLVLLAAAVALSLTGAVLVWSATRTKLLSAGDDPDLFLTKHLLNVVIGIALGLVVTRLDYRTIRSHTPLIYVVSVVALLAVLSPLGSSVNGAQAWLVLPAGFTIQPGEIAKITVVLVMANVLADRDLGTERPTATDFRRALALTAAPIVLIMLEPDLGTVLVIVSVAVGVLAVAGVRLRWLGALCAGGAGLALLAVVFGLLGQYQLDRLSTFLDPGRDPLGTGYNTGQARIAIGAGGFFGSGLFGGHQTQGAFVPYQQTDFIFSVAGEELGFFGGVAIILLLGVVVWRGCVIARMAGDMYGRIVASGVVLWFSFQAFENIGMNLGIMPVTGVPLPFVSYGGSSMFVAWIGVGLLQSVYMRSRA
ncbi:MAG: rod shape-determining protein RodA [Candidatus Nanopelagicales bacterium]|nr:rod shape-determining protein RodA [Candidatus Nanopelagicales bacterium]